MNALAISGLLILGACGSEGVSPTVPAPITTAPVTAIPSVTSSPATRARPAVERRTVTKTRIIPFATRRVSDPSLAKGTTKVRTHGVPGVKIVTYKVIFTDGVQTDKKFIRKVVAKTPVTRVIAVGTKESPQCDPNYSGACVPIASDVDCAGGSGNGPAYVQGPVRVVGTDIYGLDADGDGIGCDS
jgi:hypothetical protein